MITEKWRINFEKGRTMSAENQRNNLERQDEENRAGGDIYV